MKIEHVKGWLTPILEPMSQPNRLWIPGKDGKGLVIIAFLWEPYLKQAHPAVHELIETVGLSFAEPLQKDDDVAKYTAKFNAFQRKYAIREDERDIKNKRFPNALAWVCDSAEEQKKYDAYVDGPAEEEGEFKPWWTPQVGRGKVDLFVYTGDHDTCKWDKRQRPPEKTKKESPRSRFQRYFFGL